MRQGRKGKNEPLCFPRRRSEVQARELQQGGSWETPAMQGAWKPNEVRDEGRVRMGGLLVRPEVANKLTLE